MMEEDLPYTGPDRRRIVPSEEGQRLDNALAEIKRLNNAATELATAVSRTIPREEVQAREAQFRTLLIALAAATVFCMLLIPVLTRIHFGGRLDHLDDGQRITQCLLAKPETERTATLADTAVLACSQKVKR